MKKPKASHVKAREPELQGASDDYVRAMKDILEERRRESRCLQAKAKMKRSSQWQYRIYREVFPSGYVELSIRKAYFDQDGKPMACTERAVEPMGETLEELEGDFCMMLAAFELPIVSDDDFDSKPEDDK